MTHSYAVSVVVPSYNEAGGIEKLIAALDAVFRKMGVDGEIVVVDDNSPTGPERSSTSSPTAIRAAASSAGKLGLASAVIDAGTRVSHSRRDGCGLQSRHRDRAAVVGALTSGG